MRGKLNENGREWTCHGFSPSLTCIQEYKALSSSTEGMAKASPAALLAASQAIRAAPVATTVSCREGGGKGQRDHVERSRRGGLAVRSPVETQDEETASWHTEREMVGMPYLHVVMDVQLGHCLADWKRKGGKGGQGGGFLIS